ncbi:zinc finger MYM-type protein 1-like [Papaver somniferum]|uniref:zinc finger MYM-type protein 1-like n=1 Tax=Papaver somniferum TaxID=3469 RepID=UPI000E6F50BD|nr:zinc finger MYM-type protein 1-like [Papaver somniferum]
MTRRKTKCQSGAFKAKKRKRIEQLESSLRGSMNKYLARTSDSVGLPERISESDGPAAAETMNDINSDDSDEEYANLVNEMEKEDGLLNGGSSSGGLSGYNQNVQGKELLQPTINESEHGNDEVRNEEYGPVNIYDPGNWNFIDQHFRDFLVEKGPIRVSKNVQYPYNEHRRRFSNRHYKRKMSNGERVDRRWLVYSTVRDRVFCFSCKLFKGDGIDCQLDTIGSNDWHNLGKKLRHHDTCHGHLQSMSIWNELERRLKKNETIDKAMQEQIKREKEYWKQVLVRIVSLIKTLAKNNLAFRGDNEKIGQSNNGNFLSFIEMIAEFDLVMQDHLRRFKDQDIHHHYLSPKIQNELISLLAHHVREKIIEKVHKGKYFSVLLDCTSDISREEQMSLIVRSVDYLTTPKVEEHFLGFLKVEKTTGLGLFEEMKNLLEKLKIDFDDLRGQGYDNGANMKGKNKGVQNRLLKENPREFYMPCACHSLNLMLLDMDKSCPKAESFFSVMQRIYKLFSKSTKRWQVFKKHVTGFTVKPLSDTRWESHIESVKAI